MDPKPLRGSLNPLIFFERSAGTVIKCQDPFWAFHIQIFDLNEKVGSMG